MLICEVRLLPSSETLVFTLRNKAKGIKLWEDVLEVVPLARAHYFGLQYTDEYNKKCWLDLDESLGKQVGKANSAGWSGESILFDVAVKFWPEEPSRIDDDLVKCLLVIQLQESLLENRLRCGHQTLVKIGAYLLQSHIGNAGCGELGENYSSQFCLVPDQTPELEAEMEQLHQSDICRNLTASQCDTQILKLCSRLNEYGVHFFKALDGDGSTTEISLGMSRSGISVYSQGQKMNSFPWVMIKKCRSTSTCFYLDLHSLKGKSAEVGFKMDKWNCKQLWQLFVDFQAFYRLPTSSASSRTHPLLLQSQISVRRKSPSPGRVRFASPSPAPSLPSPEKEAQQSSGGIKLRKTRLGSARRKIVSERVTADRIIAATLSRAPSAMRSNSFSKDADSDLDISQSLSFLSPGSSTSSSGSSSDVSVALEEAEEEDDEAGKESSTTALTPHSALLACENVPLADIGDMVRHMSDDKVTNGATNAYYFVACEIRDTERSYFRDLELLSDFREEIENSRLLLPKQIAELFGNLGLLETFHRHFLAEIEDRLSYWESQSDRYAKCTVGDIMKRRMACMKVYRNYVTNESKIFELLNHWQSKMSDFARICAKFEETEAGRKPVSELFYRPFQRMVHYKELLKRLLQQSYSRESASDLADIKEALEYIQSALESVNISTKAAENARKLFRLQRELSGITNLLASRRKFIMEGVLLQLRNNGSKPKIYILFSDFLLRAVKQSSFSGTQLLAEKIYSLAGMKVDDGSDLGFCIAPAAGNSFVLIAGSSIEKKSWLVSLRETIDGVRIKGQDIQDLPVLKSSSSLKRGLKSPSHDYRMAATVSTPGKHCYNCQKKFSLFNRKKTCKRCSRAFCKKCVGNFTRLGQTEALKKVCNACHEEAIENAKLRESPSHWRSAAILGRRRGSTTSTKIDGIITAKNSFGNEIEISRDSKRPVSVATPAVPVVRVHEKLTPTASFPMSIYESQFSGGATALQKHRLKVPPSASSQPSIPQDEQILRSDHLMVRRKTDGHVGAAAGKKQKELSAPARVLLSLGDSQFSRDEEMSGYLFHKVKGRDGWKRFWLVLGSGYLKFYCSHEESQPLLYLPLPQYELSETEKRDHGELSPVLPVPCVFKLFTSSSVHYFLADNKYTMDRWVEVLVGVVKKCHGLLSTIAKHKSFVKRRIHTSH